MAVVYWIRAPHHTDVFTEGYVGFSSKTAEIRFKEHLNDAKRYQHFPVYRAIKKYGDDIVLETLVIGNNDYCLDLEFKLRPDPKIGWNLNCGGGKGPLGTEWTEEEKERRSKEMTGEGNHFFGKKHSEETRKKISDARKAFSKERKLEIYEASGLRGRVKSDAEKEKHRNSMLGKTWKRSEMPWEHHKANTQIWLMASEIFDYITKNPTHGTPRIGIYFDKPHKMFTTILRKIREGWIPTLDNKWLEFKEINNGNS